MSDDAAAVVAYRLERLHLAIRGALKDAGNEMGKDGVRIIQQLISLPYPPASQGGEPPHRRTGKLRAEYKYEVTSLGDRVEVEWGSPTEYSVYLEYGTRFMAPRPHFRPAMEIIKTSITPLVASHVESAVLAEVVRLGGR